MLLYGVRAPAQIETAGKYYDRDLVTVDLSGTIYKIRRHPEKLIMDHIVAWARDYSYTQKYKVPVPFDERHPCWIDLEQDMEHIIRGISDGK